ncbi:MAG: septal ring lytic transglycosylase RlpA family protein, partial [Venatoribacter sp.]
EAKDISTLAEPIPKEEPRSVLGNPASYKVLGKEYHVLKTAEGFRQRGEASWYGMKFHGHQTSNGEKYDVYQFTAAHKTLPLPSYVKVTRLDTGNSVVVRVNDRGPFHPGRVIDLSYAAAVKLGIDKAGTAPVEIVALQAGEREPERWVQVGAFKNPTSAHNLENQIRQHLQDAAFPITTELGKDGVNRVRIGPVIEGEPLDQLLKKLEEINITSPVLLAAHQI